MFIDMDMVESLKIVCKKCWKSKEFRSFQGMEYHNVSVKSWCKKCNDEYHNKAYCNEVEYKERQAEKARIRAREYYKNNSEKIKKYRTTRYKDDSYFNVSSKIRRRVKEGFALYSKNGKTDSCKNIGICFEAIFKRLGPMPSENMHIDHIIPLSAFKGFFDNGNEFAKLAHCPENLRWLPASENNSKNDSIDWTIIEQCPKLMEIASIIGLKKDQP